MKPQGIRRSKQLHHHSRDNYNNCGPDSAPSLQATINNNVKRTLELKRDCSSLMTKDLH